jgi:hypothetical protein
LSRHTSKTSGVDTIAFTLITGGSALSFARALRLRSGANALQWLQLALVQVSRMMEERKISEKRRSPDG